MEAINLLNRKKTTKLEKQKGRKKGNKGRKRKNKKRE